LSLMVPNAKKEILPLGPHPKVMHKDKRTRTNIETKGLAVLKTQFN
jgi:hypothetical protein